MGKQCLKYIDQLAKNRRLVIPADCYSIVIFEKFVQIFKGYLIFCLTSIILPNFKTPG